MRRAPIVGWRRRSGLIACALWLGACANVLGLNTYREAAVALCEECDALLDDCEGRLQSKLAAATEEERSAWLELLRDRKCVRRVCDDLTLECFYSAPDNCAEAGEPCAHAQGCCAFDFETPETGGTCCRGDGEGACCDDCLSCAEMLDALKPGGETDISKLCISHVATWEAVVVCTNEAFLAECEGSCNLEPGGMPCVKCLLGACEKEIVACNANEAP